jgi:GTP-binding protein
MKAKRNMVISLIGRPNVGKSSLFNRLMRKNHALTHDLPGVTRDRHYGVAKFNDDPYFDEEVEAIMVDTGGFYPQKIEESGANQKEIEFNHFFNIMNDHAKLAIDESDLVLFIVDAREGVLPFDEGIADFIRSRKKPFWLLINKFDTENQRGDENEFYSLGLNPEELFTVSAAHGLGLEWVREAIHREILVFNNKVDEAPGLQRGVTPREKVAAKLALIGAPNAGKSTLLNLLVGSERALVSDIAGTTVDPIEGYFDLYFGKDSEFLEEEVEAGKNDGLLLQQYQEFRKNNAEVYIKMEQAFNEEDTLVPSELEMKEPSLNKSDEKLFNQVFNDLDESSEATGPKGENSWWRSLHIVDTAGIRRKSNVDGVIESQSVYRSLRCITESDIVIYMIDATRGIGHQDCRLLDIALEKGKSVIVCLNKMDLMKEILKTDEERKEWLLDLRAKIPWLDFCDIIPISAVDQTGINKLKKSLKKTTIVRRRSIPTGVLNRVVLETVAKHSVILKKTSGKPFKVKYASMIKSDPPTFLLFSNKSQGIPANYKRYLQNSLRKEFEIVNTPVHLIFRTGADMEKRLGKNKARAIQKG